MNSYEKSSAELFVMYKKLESININSKYLNYIKQQVLDSESFYYKF